jgi:hypothetical protein
MNDKAKTRIGYWLIILFLLLWCVWLQTEIADRDTVIYWQRIDLQGFRMRFVGI